MRAGAAFSTVWRAYRRCLRVSACAPLQRLRLHRRAISLSTTVFFGARNSSARRRKGRRQRNRHHRRSEAGNEYLEGRCRRDRDKKSPSILGCAASWCAANSRGALSSTSRNEARRAIVALRKLYYIDADGVVVQGSRSPGKTLVPSAHRYCGRDSDRRPIPSRQDQRSACGSAI